MRKIFRSLVALLSTAIVFGLIASGCETLQGSSETGERETSSLAPGRNPIVLISPIDTLLSEEECVYLSDALAPLIRRDLFCVKSISVVPTANTHSPTKTYFLKKNGLIKLALSHGADIITIGMLKAEESNISIEFAAYDVPNNKTIFKTTVDGKMSRALRLEKEIVNQFIEALGISLSKEERERIASNAPSKVDAAIAYGRGLKELQRDRYAEALIAFEEAGDIDESLAIADVARATVFENMNASAKATKVLEHAVATDKYYAEAWYLLNIHAVMYEKNNDLAMDYCYQALEVAPLFGRARLSLGARLYVSGDLNGAIEQTKMAAELLPVDAMPRYNLGVFCRALGNNVEARRWFEEALQRDPEFERARVALKNLPKE